MHYLEKYYNDTVRPDLITKFNYKNNERVPKIKSLTLNFGCRSSDFKKLSISFLSLQFITKKRGEIIPSKKSNILLKIRSGDPVGCKVILKGKLMYRTLTEIMKIKSNPKNDSKLNVTKSNSVTFSFGSPLVFNVLEENYTFFSEVGRIHVSILTNCDDTNEVSFLLNSFKLI